jgi:pimeloyl-ACP methyl ester carboxylesterase
VALLNGVTGLTNLITLKPTSEASGLENRVSQALLLLSNAAVPTAIWDPVVPLLAGAHRVIRVDLLGRGRSTSPADRYDIPTQARRVGAALDRLGISQVTVIGHSSGCTVATALAEQRPDAVAALALIDMGPSPDAKIPERLLFRLLLAPLTGRLLWRLRTEATIRKAARAGFTRPVDASDLAVYFEAVIWPRRGAQRDAAAAKSSELSCEDPAYWLV